ncbi:SGNH/GDSL hydrolase family protein [Paractinoplanes rishiriensis]|uniref:SGNH hydrolase-type esterase domain-containing protein n=1 Tax=Paractinoplanes rishiriensis TaxID=1050105 RepID=A0A919JXQ5_9ACTN|nr:SGNH/GDSL hydrolase family protein [Actinoplanes rishiriensis]GIE95013.1 hypothetical protein Ari01nite_24780 [Actinoplanes rishiriensis]
MRDARTTTLRRRFAAAMAAPAVLLGLLSGPAAEAAVRPAETERPSALRVMPLGDSITWGIGSADRDGYRAALHRRLTSAGLDVDFVGSARNGRGPDRDHEGHKGWTINQLAEHVEPWLTRYQPDVILLHIGTNDLVQGVPQPARKLARLLDLIEAAQPDAEVFVARVVGLADYPNLERLERRTAAFNRAVGQIVTERGGRFHLVDQSVVRGIDMRNEVHPNDVGYARMAWNWYRAMEPVLNVDGTEWPQVANPDEAATSFRCIEYSTLHPAVRGCRYWYLRGPNRTWQLPVTQRVHYQEIVDGEVVDRVKLVTRWVSAR